jgi:hypothetical protein
MPGVWILDECSPADEARLRTFAEDALGELGAEMNVSLHLADGPRADLRFSTLGWASAAGAHIVVDALEFSDRKLRHLVYHEVAHWFAFQEFPALQGPFWHEVFASCFAGRSGFTASRSPDSDAYTLGVRAGAALAGDPAARELVPRGQLDLITCLEDIREPRAFAAALLDHQGVPGPRGLQRPGCEKCPVRGEPPATILEAKRRLSRF